MSGRRVQGKGSPLRELFAAIGILAILSPYFLSFLAPDPPRTAKALLIVLGLLLTFGGMLALLYGLSYPGLRKRSARTPEDPAAWKMPPEAADDPLYDLSSSPGGSSTGVRPSWQHNMAPLRWTIMPERLWRLPELEWRPLPVTLGLGTLGLLATVIPWMLAYLTRVGDTEWASVFRFVQLLLLVGGLALLWFVAPRVRTEQLSAEHREQLAKDRDYFKRKRGF